MPDLVEGAGAAVHGHEREAAGAIQAAHAVATGAGILPEAELEADKLNLFKIYCFINCVKISSLSTSSHVSSCC